MSPFYDGSSALSNSHLSELLPLPQSAQNTADVSSSDSFLAKHDAEVKSGSKAGKVKIESVGERALTAGGLHLSEGGKIWQAYR